MDRKTEERVFKVFKKVTGREIDHLNFDRDLKSQLTLDSIQIVELFAALEKELEVELPLNMMTVKTGKAFMEMLEEQLDQE
jgi:acyl carrier protein